MFDYGTEQGHQAKSAWPRGLKSIQQMTFAADTPRVLSAAVELDTFSILASGPMTSEQVAATAKANDRGMRMLLDALTGLELLIKQGNKYELSELATRYFVKNSPDYCCSMLEGDWLSKPWESLTEVIRTGRPVFRANQEDEAQRFFPKLIKSLHIFNREAARSLAAHLATGLTGEVPRVIDTACGSGVWGIAVAEANAKVRVTAQDYPAILEITRGYIQRHKLEERFDYLAGDLKTTDFGLARFDLALLGNIVHSEGERSSRDLFRRLAQALKPGGRIAIVDMIPNDERTGPAFPLLFALTVLLNTDHGDTYTFKEYSQWLKEVGFTKVEAADIGSLSPVIMATRA